MNDDDPTSAHGSLPDGPVWGPPSEPPASLPDRSAPVTTAGQTRWQRVRRSLSYGRTRWFVAAAALMCAVLGLFVALATSPSAPVGQPAAGSAAPAGPGSRGAGGPGTGGDASNARSGPAAGGSSGTVESVSGAGFTMSTPAGQQVTVNEATSTLYRNGTGSTSADAVTAGVSVLVLGTTNGTTITATQVIVQPAGDGGSAASAAAGVVPFQRGAPTTAKQVGQVPPAYSQGSGTIVSGTPADKATEAALASYPGGVVDRVVQLSSGEYEVHNIGVNWPHHIFVDQGFKVIGAE